MNGIIFASSAEENIRKKTNVRGKIMEDLIIQSSKTNSQRSLNMEMSLQLNGTHCRP